MTSTTKEEIGVATDYVNPFVAPSDSEEVPVIIPPAHFTSTDWTERLKKF